MREVVHTDGDGCRFKVLLPDDVPEDHAEMGIRVGPPDLEELGLPTDLRVRLNNLLFDRGYFTAKDVRRKMPELLGVWQAALRVDIQKLHAVYEGVAN